MSALGCMLRAAFAVTVLSMSGCASGGDDILRPQGPKGYVIAVRSSIDAEKGNEAKAGADLYFGDHVVRGLGGDQGDSSKRPQGAVIVFWSASEDSGEKEYDQQFKQWFPIPKNQRFYYASAIQSQLTPYPAKTPGHQYYGIYVSAGRTVVSPEGLRPEDAPHATEFITGRAKRKNYVFGREDTVYYKILSRGPGSASAEDDPSPWHTFPGVALTEAQYMEMSMCNPDTLTQAGSGKPCRVFLSIDDPDLTPGQREYVRQHPFTRKDIAPLIREFKRAARISDRWL